MRKSISFGCKENFKLVQYTTSKEFSKLGNKRVAEEAAEVVAGKPKKRKERKELFFKCAKSCFLYYLSRDFIPLVNH
jgi:hypothetical protein